MIIDQPSHYELDGGVIMMLANILFYITGTGPPVTGFSNFGQPTGFSTSLPQPAAFGNFGTATTTASGFKGNYFLHQ